MIEQTCAEIAQKALDREYRLGLLAGWVSILIGWGQSIFQNF